MPALSACFYLPAFMLVYYYKYMHTHIGQCKQCMIVPAIITDMLLILSDVMYVTLHYMHDLVSLYL